MRSQLQSGAVRELQALPVRIGFRTMQGLDAVAAWCHVAESKIASLLDGLAHLPTLEFLDLSNSPIADSHLHTIVRTLPALHSLDLSNTAVTDSGLEELEQLPHLKYLHLGFFSTEQITGRALINVSELSNLKHLDLSGSHFTDEDLLNLAALKKLKMLDLRNMRISGSGLAFINLEELETLDLSDTTLSDEELAHVVKLKRLKHLEIGGTKVRSLARWTGRPAITY
jgi:Leucine-rich repeat (LRR) protein